MNTNSQKIIALLGPTNTGKTHVAIEKMIESTTGIKLPADANIKEDDKMFPPK